MPELPDAPGPTDAWQPTPRTHASGTAASEAKGREAAARRDAIVAAKDAPPDRWRDASGAAATAAGIALVGAGVAHRKAVAAPALPHPELLVDEPMQRVRHGVRISTSALAVRVRHGQVNCMRHAGGDGGALASEPPVGGSDGARLHAAGAAHRAPQGVTGGARSPRRPLCQTTWREQQHAAAHAAAWAALATAPDARDSLRRWEAADGSPVLLRRLTHAVPAPAIAPSDGRALPADGRRRGWRANTPHEAPPEERGEIWGTARAAGLHRASRDAAIVQRLAAEATGHRDAAAPTRSPFRGAPPPPALRDATRSPARRASPAVQAARPPFATAADRPEDAPRTPVRGRRRVAPGDDPTLLAPTPTQRPRTGRSLSPTVTTSRDFCLGWDSFYSPPAGRAATAKPTAPLPGNASVLVWREPVVPPAFSRTDVSPYSRRAHTPQSSRSILQWL